MNTNILEIATFAAIGVLACFLVMMNDPEVGSTGISKDELGQEVDTQETNNTFYQLDNNNDLISVTMGAGDWGEEGDELTYSWEWIGSFIEKEKKDEGIRLHDPISKQFIWDENATKWKLDDLQPNWKEIDAPNYDGDLTDKNITVDMPEGVHVYTCKVTNMVNGQTNANEDDKYDNLVIYVKGVPEKAPVSPNVGLWHQQATS